MHTHHNHPAHPARVLALLLFLLLPLLALQSPTRASSTDALHADTAFDTVLLHYEAVRQSLVDDSMDGVADRSAQIHHTLEALARGWAAEGTDVDSTGAVSTPSADLRALLPLLRTAADELTRASTLDAARDAFYALSKPLVRWRKAAAREELVVAYCPMLKRSWLQSAGDLGNPYHGPSMRSCGDVVDGGEG